MLTPDEVAADAGIARAEPGALAKLARTHQSMVSQLELGREVNAEVGARVRAALGIE